jgi:hypothetical protein
MGSNAFFAGPYNPESDVSRTGDVCGDFLSQRWSTWIFAAPVMARNEPLGAGFPSVIERTIDDSLSSGLLPCSGQWLLDRFSEELFLTSRA